jgi:hypothetical protein
VGSRREGKKKDENNNIRKTRRKPIKTARVLRRSTSEHTYTSLSYRSIQEVKLLKMVDDALPGCHTNTFDVEQA